jgi:hypothetical protein
MFRQRGKHSVRAGAPDIDVRKAQLQQVGQPRLQLDGHQWHGRVLRDQRLGDRTGARAKFHEQPRAVGRVGHCGGQPARGRTDRAHKRRVRESDHHESSIAHGRALVLEQVDCAAVTRRRSRWHSRNDPRAGVTR